MTFSLVSAALLFCGCDRCRDHPHGHPHEHVENHVRAGKRVHDHGGGHVRSSAPARDCGADRGVKAVTVPSGVQRVMGLKTVRVGKRDVKATFECSGRYELLPGARSGVATPVSGYLRFLVKPLDKVKKGDALFTVTSPDLVKRSGEIAVLEKRLKVYRSINTRNAALENELAVKRAARLALVAGAEEKDGVVTVRAVEDAMIETFIARNGDWLETGGAALQTVRTQALRFKALVAASDALRLKDGLEAKVGDFTGEIRLGVGDDTGLVPVYVVFKGEIGALAGACAQAVVSTGAKLAVRPAVPSRCIVTVGLRPTLFVKDASDPERFIAVNVVPVGSGGGWTALESLPSGVAEVVCEGAYELKLALPGGETKSAGHFHADGTFHEGEH